MLDTIPVTPNDWRVGLQVAATEVDEEVEAEVDGVLPAELEGVLYRNGPGRVQVHGENVHWFDGDGMVHRVRLGSGRAFYRSRWVETAGKRAEDEAGRRLFGGFGRRPPGGLIDRVRRRRLKNAANTHVALAGDELLALWEGGHPHRLDPVTLETRGQTDLQGLLRPLDTFASHPKIDPATGDLWGFGLAPGLRSHLNLYRVPAVGPPERAASVPLPFLSVVHDIGLTGRHVVAVLGPLRLPRLPLLMLLAQRAPFESLRWDASHATVILVVDRVTGAARTTTTEALLSFHVANAYDDGEDVVVDVCSYPDDRVLSAFADVLATAADDLPVARLERIRVRAGGGAERRRLSSAPFEFPLVAPWRRSREHRVVYGLTNHPDGTPGLPAAVDVSTGHVVTARLAPHMIASECLPIARGRGEPADERDVWLVTVVLDVARQASAVLVLDGADLGAPPIARISLPHPIPLGFHGTWAPAARGPMPAVGAGPA